MKQLRKPFEDLSGLLQPFILLNMMKKTVLLLGLLNFIPALSSITLGNPKLSKDTLFFQNDTISQTLIWEKVNDLKISFWLSSKDTHQQKACIFQGEAERPDGWDFDDETCMDADGKGYPASEYWYHGKDVEFSVRISHDLQKARIYSLKNPSLPFIYTLRKKSAPDCPPASALTLYESVRSVAYQHYKSGF